MARTSLKEVADRAGVAISSVSRVLSGHPDTSPAMRERVMSVVEELGYRPDFLAQSMRRRSTLSVGFVVGDISNPLLAEITLGAETALRAAGYAMFLTNSGNQPSLDAEHIELFQQRRVDGLLLSLASEDNPATLGALEASDLPIVLIDRELPDSVTFPVSAVLSDHHTGMRQAAGHLLDLGHRRIALIISWPLRFSRERRTGLHEAYAERNLESTYVVLEERVNAAQAQKATAELLDAPEPPTAIIAGSNQLAIGVLREFRRRKLTPGDEVSLVTCDEIPLLEFVEPAIALVRRDSRQLGVAAAELLLKHLGDDQQPPETVMLPTEFVAAQSCAPPLETKAGRAAGNGGRRRAPTL